MAKFLTGIVENLTPFRAVRSRTVSQPRIVLLRHAILHGEEPFLYLFKEARASCFHRRLIYKGDTNTHAHTHRELIREWLWEPKCRAARSRTVSQPSIVILAGRRPSSQGGTLSTASQTAHRRASYLHATDSQPPDTAGGQFLLLPSNLPRGGFTEFISAVISALGYLPLWGNSKLQFRVQNLPRVPLKLLFGPNLDSTGCILLAFSRPATFSALAFTKYAFTSRLSCTIKLYFHPPAPTCIVHSGAILLHDH